MSRTSSSPTSDGRLRWVADRTWSKTVASSTGGSGSMPRPPFLGASVRYGRRDHRVWQNEEVRRTLPVRQECAPCVLIVSEATPRRSQRGAGGPTRGGATVVDTTARPGADSGAYGSERLTPRRRGNWLFDRQLDRYPDDKARSRYLAITVLATVILY